MDRDSQIEFTEQFMKTMQKRIFALFFSLAAAGCLLILSGCNSKMPGDSSTAAPKLSIDGGQGGDSNAPASGTATNGAAANAAPADQAAETSSRPIRS